VRGDEKWVAWVPDFRALGRWRRRPCVWIPRVHGVVGPESVTTRRRAKELGIGTAGSDRICEPQLGQGGVARRHSGGSIRHGSSLNSAAGRDIS
jgi:hypothetical protein